MKIQEGDWCIYDLKIVQIMKGEPYTEYSDGFIRGGGATVGNFRPLTLRNKVIIESINHLYDRLRNIDGESGFNYPDISSYFSNLALDAIDGGEAGERKAYDKAQAFVMAAKEYTPIIDGVRLFRRNLSRA